MLQCPGFAHRPQYISWSIQITLRSKEELVIIQETSYSTKSFFNTFLTFFSILYILFMPLIHPIFSMPLIHPLLYVSDSSFFSTPVTHLYFLCLFFILYFYACYSSSTFYAYFSSSIFMPLIHHLFLCLLFILYLYASYSSSASLYASYVFIL